jgi:hypothetical protein
MSYVVHEPPEQACVLDEAVSLLGHEPPAIEKFVELNTLSRFSDPHFAHFISTFSSLLRNRISIFSAHAAHSNSYMGMGFSPLL